MSETDPVPALARDVMSLFEEALAEQRFGDVDRESLERLAERTRADAERVEAARAALDDAQQALERSRGALFRRAEQGLAYARVFAADAPELAARLEALDARRAPKKKPKRRAKKTVAKASDVAELPFEERAAAGG